MTGSSDERRGSRRKKSARFATLIGLVLAVAFSAKPTARPASSAWPRAS